MNRDLLAVLFVIVVLSAPVHAAASPEEAAALKTTLTPMGAERAGTSDGAIPPWEGGYTTPFPGFVPGSVHLDPFAAEKPLRSISAQNMAEHENRLTEGTRALLEKFPQSYRIDVYPTHRTASAPQWVYDNNLRNAVVAKLVDSSSGLIPHGAYGGIPFPIPQNGSELIWNHILRWRGEATLSTVVNYMGTSNGKRVLVTGGTFETQQPYYFREGVAEKLNDEYTVLRINIDAPPSRSGEVFVERDNFNPDKSNFWVYVPGQRRVLKLPASCCDTPLPTSGGVINFDEPDVWNGRIDQYDWKLLGKKEMYIPYNANRSQQAAVDQILLSNHLNPDHVRWELHRVWVVEAVLAAGKKNAAAKGRYYLDEDTWVAVLADRWDANGRLIKTLWALPILMPEFPTVAAPTSGGHDLVNGSWIVMGMSNGKASAYRSVARYPDLRFTPDALAGEGVR